MVAETTLSIVQIFKFRESDIRWKMWRKYKKLKICILWCEDVEWLPNFWEATFSQFNSIVRSFWIRRGGEYARFINKIQKLFSKYWTWCFPSFFWMFPERRHFLNSRVIVNEMMYKALKVCGHWQYDSFKG